MSASLVGSEMCIRDSSKPEARRRSRRPRCQPHLPRWACAVHALLRPLPLKDSWSPLASQPPCDILAP
eukprot:2792936-Alexandrium_andersonii.AAC.1